MFEPKRFLGLLKSPLFSMASAFALMAVLPQHPAYAQGVSEAEAPEAADEEEAPKKLKPVLYYLIDGAQNFSGGVTSGGTFMGALVNGLDFNLGEIFSKSPALKGTHFYIDHFAAWGRPSSGKTGDIQMTLNSWSPESIRLQQVWLEKEWEASSGSKFSLRVGAQDMNWEFQLTDASIFMANSSFTLSPELMLSGPVGPATFPYTSLGARAAYTLNDNFKFMAGAYDGVPTNMENVDRFNWDLSAEDGVMGIAEATWTGKIRGMASRASLGGWGYSNRGGVGAYMLLEQRIYEPRRGGATGLTAFARLGQVLKEDNTLVDRSITAGLTYTGILRGRPDDKLALGVAMARAGAASILKAQEEEVSITSYETAYELAYRAQIRPNVFVMPDFQYIRSPSFQTEVADAVTGGVRLEVNL